MKVSRMSPWSGQYNTMDLAVSPGQMEEFMNTPRHERRKVQDIFPSLSPAEREFLLSGYTPQDWEECFGQEDVEEANPWTDCSCGHIAQDHNRAGNDIEFLPDDAKGPISGNEHGNWTDEDCASIRHWGCDHCKCTKYDGHTV